MMAQIRGFVVAHSQILTITNPEMALEMIIFFLILEKKITKNAFQEPH
jgi:hypothetical protein